MLGDSAYGTQNYICKPLPNPVSVPERRYQNAQVKTRNAAERAIGGIKRVFPCLALGMRFKLDKVQDVIVACCILYNFKKESERNAENQISQEERGIQNNLNRQLAAERIAANRHLTIQNFLMQNHFNERI